MRRSLDKIAGLFWLATLLSSWGGDAAAFRVLRIPASEAPGLRAALRDPAVGTQEVSMEKLVKSRNLEVLAEFRQDDPWIGRPVELVKSMGGIENGGELMELGVKLEIEGSAGHPDVRHGVEITLPAGGKKALFRQVLWSGTRGRSGSWVERCCWSDGKEALMLWEYPVVEEKLVSGGKRPVVHVEMRWFKAAEADVAKLGASQPETREKALQWLEGRAKPRREAGYDVQFGNPCIWVMSEGRHDPENGVSVSDDAFTIETKGAEEAGGLKMEWKMTTSKGDREESRTLNADMESGLWEFLPLNDDPGANVIACRATKS